MDSKPNGEMENTKIYSDFSEIEEEVRAFLPSCMYKYREWKYDFHQAILTENKIWFAHPKKLNDPFDIRVPLKIELDKVESQEFFERLKEMSKNRYNKFHPDSREFNALCENAWDEIKLDPNAYFKNNLKALRESDVYDMIGVFSLTSDPLNEAMWAYYSGNSSGFVVGFDTIGLVKHLGFKFGYVKYSDEIPVYNLIEGNQGSGAVDTTYLKNSKWIHEQEFRILTYQIKSDDDRKVSFPQDLIKEIIVGSEASNVDIELIVNELRNKYNGSVPLFRAVISVHGGLEKEEIAY